MGSEAILDHQERYGAELQMQTLSAQSANLITTNIELHDPHGLYYGQIVSIDTVAADVIKGTGITDNASITVMGGTTIRTPVTLKQNGGGLLRDLHTTIKAMGQQPSKFVTLDGGSVFVLDKQGRWWAAGKTQPMDKALQQSALDMYNKLANEILSNPTELELLKKHWQAHLAPNKQETLNFSDPNVAEQTVYGNYIAGNDFELQLFAKDQHESVQIQNTYNHYTYPQYPWTGGHQNSADWAGRGTADRYLYKSTLNPLQKIESNIIGCGPAAFGAIIAEMMQNKGYKINRRIYPKNDGIDGKTYQALRQFLYGKIDGIPRLAHYMDSSHFEVSLGSINGRGVMTLPGGLERGMSKLLNEHVRRPDGSIPRWIGGSRKVGATNEKMLHAALESAIKRQAPLMMGFWLPKEDGNSGHYTPVVEAYVNNKQGSSSNVREIFAMPAENTHGFTTSKSYYQINNTWSAFGGLWTVD